jgi:hypothetical protein
MKRLFLALAFLVLPALAQAQTCIQADLTHPLSAQLTWTDNSNNEAGFSLEKKVDSGAYVVIAGGIGANLTSFTDMAVTRSTVARTYTYRIKALAVPNSGVTDSTYSNESCITFAPLAPVPLKPPSGLTVAQASSSSINASWSDNSDNETNFRVELSSFSPPRSLSRTTGANVTSLLISGLQKNKTYCGKVVAFNLDQESDPSNQSCATTAAR